MKNQLHLLLSKMFASHMLNHMKGIQLTHKVQASKSIILFKKHKQSSTFQINCK